MDIGSIDTGQIWALILGLLLMLSMMTDWNGGKSANTNTDVKKKKEKSSDISNVSWKIFL